MMGKNTSSSSAVVAEATCSAPVNIAVIKYWGKRDSSLLLPTNSSLSLTLSQDHLQSKTTVRVMKHQHETEEDPKGDALFLNGVKQDILANKRFLNVIHECRLRRVTLEELHTALPRIAQYPLHIVSENNFPTAAGLASSASGFACLTYTIAQVYGLISSSENEVQLDLDLGMVSKLARMGSGSACRSLYGGFVAWEMGSLADGSDSIAVQVAPSSHWPDMEALILVVSDTKKHTSSTQGMQTTVNTSPLLQHRIKDCVPARMAAIQTAIKNKDFSTFAEITMQDSNQFHAVCLDTFPPIFYLTDTSRHVIALIHEYNRAAEVVHGDGKKYRAAYTFDAGPNAVIYAEREWISEILAVLNVFIPPPADITHSSYFGRGVEYLGKTDQHQQGKVDAIVAEIISKGPAVLTTPLAPGSLRRIISTQIGDGPRLLCRGFNQDISLTVSE